MNSVVLMGRLTGDPEIKDISADMKVARYTLAVDRRIKKGDVSADFINCTVFGKGVEFVDKYLKKGLKIAIHGSIRTGSYTNREGKKVYTFEVVVDDHDFAEKAER